ncbi:MAG TPA: hypothetical protein VKP30_22420 [Polyangiaceae bacterium]|nr:hypothetical protein [Polyangiaceae bacterium]
MGVFLGLSFGESTLPTGWARVWGGPTEGPTPFNIRVEFVIPNPAHATTQPAPIAQLRIEAEGAEPKLVPLAFDDASMAYVALPYPLRNPRVSIISGKQRLAEGNLHLDQATYWRQRKVREGRLRGKTSGTWSITVGCREGAFVLGQPGTLAVAINDAAGGAVTTPFTLELDGFEDTTIRTPVALHTDASGRAQIPVVPKDFAASVRVRVGEREHPIASFFSSIPVATANLRGGARDGKLQLESLVPTRRAYYALVSEQGQWASGGVNLDCHPNGSCRTELALNVEAPHPAWLMVGTEPALDGPNVIGWPVASDSAEFVPDAVTIRDQLLLDGKPLALADAASRNRSRSRAVLVGMAIALAVLLHAILSPILRSRGATKGLEEALGGAAVVATGHDEKGVSRVSRKRARSALGSQPLIATALVLVLILVAFAALVAWIRGTLLQGPLQ